MPQTNNWALPYPSLSDPPNVPLDLQRLATAAEGALDQHYRIYPGTSEDDIALAGNAKTIVNWTYSIPSTWQSAIVLFYYQARQWSDSGKHIRTGYRISANGAQNGPTVQEGVWVPAGDAGARMISAARVWGGVGTGTQRITVTGEIQIGANGTANIGAQMWFVVMLRTK